MAQKWISLINYEGDCLAFRQYESDNRIIEDKYEIKDQFGIILGTYTGEWILEFASGMHTIKDSQQHEWDFTKQHQDAVISDNDLYKIIRGDEDTGYQKSMEFIAGRLHTVSKFGLDAEVVTYALKFMKENNHASIEEAFEAGCAEWDV